MGVYNPVVFVTHNSTLCLRLPLHPSFWNECLMQILTGAERVERVSGMIGAAHRGSDGGCGGVGEGRHYNTWTSVSK